MLSNFCFRPQQMRSVDQTSLPVVAGMFDCVMGFSSSLKDSPHDVLDRHFLDVDVVHRQFIEKRFADGDDSVALHTKLNCPRPLFDDFAKASEVLLRTITSAFAVYGDQLEVGKAIHHGVEWAVEEDCAVINDDHALHNSWMSAM